MQLDRRYLNVRVTVDGVVDAPVSGAPVGAQYLVSATPTTGSEFENQANKIAYKSAAGWQFYKNFAGQSEVIDLTNGLVYKFDGTEWQKIDIASENVHNIVDKRILDPVDGVLVAIADVDGDGPLPESGNTNDLVLDTEALKLYTATTTGENPFDAGVAVTNGIYAYADGTTNGHGYLYIIEDGELETLEMQDGTVFINKSNEDLYTFDATTGTLINVTDIGARPEYRRHSITVEHAITAEELTAKKFSLPKLAILSEGVRLSVGGLTQVKGVDFSAANENNKTVIDFDGFGLDAIDIKAGDVFVITYDTEVM